MKTLCLALLLLSGWSATAQTAPACPVFATDSSAQAWVASVRQLPLKQQVAALQQRVACDGGVRGWAPAVCTLPLSAAQRQVYEENCRRAEAADPRPRAAVLLCVVNGRLVAPGAPAELQRLLANKKIRRLEFLEGAPAAALYGSRGAAGVALVTAK
ncbi:hypothetical protein [Hymenobacter sp. PAMC 26628]|uniref:hypothetical protein n=1 Tax=Hymenobacter sp. PAMC 26628 TaxID=1484118 RepID=UPI0007700085|nr:hypothetical protein [Hymenobacter sp. PAMC 26628]AMJ66866.1 hypothetical protein AXW84_16590 [Hymenobacter sp. PAMC 26628]